MKDRFVRVVLSALAVITLSALVVAACGGGSDDEPEATTTTTTEPPPPTAPLTGLPDPGGEASTRAALWVKVGNNSDGRPQTGLELADVVYEEVAEGGVTRFAAIFNSVVPDRVGPVRSVRPMDVDLVQPLLGIFAYSGGAPGPTNMIESVEGLLTVDETAAGGEAMARDPNRLMPNNLYVLGPEMFARGGDPKPPPALFEFRPDASDENGASDESDADNDADNDNDDDDNSADTDASVADEADVAVESFVVGFSVEPVTWRWDAATAGWLRFLGETPFSTIDGNQISATNVIVQFIHYPNDSEGITVGEGQAWVFTNGTIVRGTWQRDDARSAIRYLDAAGEPILLTPGRTWVQLVPNAATVDVIGATPVPTEAP